MMCTPPKLAVFVFVLTIHLAILAFAFPRLDLADPAQSTPATSTAATIDIERKSVSTDTEASERPPSTQPNPHAAPVQHHQTDQLDTEQQAGDKRGGPTVTHELHQHSVAETTESNPQQPEASAVKSDRAASAHPEQVKPSLPTAKDPPAEPIASAKPTPSPVALTKAEPANAPADAVNTPKPKPVSTATAKPEPKPVAVSRQTTANSTKAGSGRMSNLRPLKDGLR